MTNLSGLNKTQRNAVLTTDGPMMILAGAGSGKTRTLVTKISYLLEEKNVSTHRLLALTFSNKAAKEMRERISSSINIDIGALQITTFHSFCARLLRTEATYLGLSRNFTIYDTSESKSVVKSILSRHGISPKEVSPYEVLYYIDRLKNLGYSLGDDLPDEFDGDDQFYRFFLEYEEEIARANAVDFGGLITGTIKLFMKYENVLKTYQNRYEYVLVDEYQDTNKAQFILLNLISKKKKNICVVGDEDQSIYSWRGADILNILDFESHFPNVKILKLEQNYRSSKTIIEAASHVISHNTMRKGKKMWTENPSGESIRIFELTDEKQEATFVADEVKSLATNSVSLNDISVFYRTNSQSRLIEDYLRRSNIPYRVVGGVKFYERKEIKDIVAYLRLFVNKKDSLALSRVINVPARGIGATTLRKLENEAVKNNCSLWESLCLVVENYEKYSEIKLSKKIRSSLETFVTLIQDCRLLVENKERLSLILEKVLSESGYIDFLESKKDYESIARLENIEEFKNAVLQFEKSSKNPTLIGFLEGITLDTSVEGENVESLDGEVSLMTVHGAKGLEFPYVFIIGAEENLFPSYKSMELGEPALEEERRLFYVAMTRAMKRLYILFAQGRMLFGQLKFNGPTRFIMEIPDEFYKWDKIRNDREEEFNQSDSWDDEFSQETHYDDGPTIQIGTNCYQYPVGTGVIHAIYGAGEVLDSQGNGGDEKVVIKFIDGTKKKFLVKFAPLVKS